MAVGAVRERGEDASSVPQVLSFRRPSRAVAKLRGGDRTRTHGGLSQFAIFIRCVPQTTQRVVDAPAMRPPGRSVQRIRGNSAPRANRSSARRATNPVASGKESTRAEPDCAVVSRASSVSFGRSETERMQGSPSYTPDFRRKRRRGPKPAKGRTQPSSFARVPPPDWVSRRMLWRGWSCTVLTWAALSETRTLAEARSTGLD